MLKHIAITRFFLLRARDAMLASVAFIIYMQIMGGTLPHADEIAYVAFDQFETTSTIHLIDIERGLSAAFFTRYGRIDDLSWSPDGETLYFGLFREEEIRRDLAQITISNGEFRWLTDFPPDNNVPEASPDGTQIVFQHFDPIRNDWDIYLLDVLTGETRLLYASNYTDGRPVWDNDGQTIIVENYPNNGICILRVAAQSGIIQTSECGEPGNLAWSPDRTLTAFDLYRDSTTDIYIGDENATHPRRMTRLNGFAYAPDWSPDGRRLVYVFSGASGLPDALYIMDLLDETPHQITPADTIHLAPTWRP